MGGDGRELTPARMRALAGQAEALAAALTEAQQGFRQSGEPVSLAGFRLDNAIGEARSIAAELQQTAGDLARLARTQPEAGQANATSDPWAASRAHHAKTTEHMAVMKAEDAVRDARLAELHAEAAAAWRRHRAAKGLLTKALKDGNADKIAAAHERERQAYTEADHTGRRNIEEAQQITGQKLADLGQLIDRLGDGIEHDGQALDEHRRGSGQDQP
jgi:hypothetical protein